MEEIFLHVRYGRCNGKTEATRRYDEAMIAAVTALRSSEKKMSEWYWDMDNHDGYYCSDVKEGRIMETEKAINTLRMMHLASEDYDEKEAILMAIGALKKNKMTNREYLIKLLESGDKKIVRYLNCAACAFDENQCKIGDKCALGVLKFLNAEREQKKGKWITPSRNPDFVNKDFFCDCSVCGFTTSNEQKECPNCGAYMETDE